MFNFGGATGMTMMLQSLAPMLGIDGPAIQKKVADFERMAKTVASAIESKVTHMDGEISDIGKRIDRIESLLVLALNKSEALTGAVVPAGDSWSEVTNGR